MLEEFFRYHQLLWLVKRALVCRCIEVERGLVFRPAFHRLSWESIASVSERLFPSIN